MKKGFADFITKRGTGSITDQGGQDEKVEDGHTEQVHPPLQALALLKDHQVPLSLAETVR